MASHAPKSIGKGEIGTYMQGAVADIYLLAVWQRITRRTTLPAQPPGVRHDVIVERTALRA